MPAFTVEIDTSHGQRAETITADTRDEAIAKVLERIPELELEAIRRYEAGELDCADLVSIGRWKRAQVRSVTASEV
jgi:hypothetical protein